MMYCITNSTLMDRICIKALAHIKIEARLSQTNIMAIKIRAMMI